MKNFMLLLFITIAGFNCNVQAMLPTSNITPSTLSMERAALNSIIGYRIELNRLNTWMNSIPQAVIVKENTIYQEYKQKSNDLHNQIQARTQESRALSPQEFKIFRDQFDEVEKLTQQVITAAHSTTDRNKIFYDMR